MNDIEKMVSELARQRSKLVKEALIKTIEEHLGRVPTIHEVVKHGMRYECDGVVDYYWDRHFLFSAYQLGRLKPFVIGNIPLVKVNGLND